MEREESQSETGNLVGRGGEQQRETRGVGAARGAETLGEEPAGGCCAEPLRGGPSLILTNTLQGRNSVLHLIGKVAESRGS